MATSALNEAIYRDTPGRYPEVLSWNTDLTSSGTRRLGDGGSLGQSRQHIDVAQWFNNHPDFARAATKLSEAGATRLGIVCARAATTATDPAAGVGEGVRPPQSDDGG